MAVRIFYTILFYSISILFFSMVYAGECLTELDVRKRNCLSYCRVIEGKEKGLYLEKEQSCMCDDPKPYKELFKQTFKLDIDHKSKVILDEWDL